MTMNPGNAVIDNDFAKGKINPANNATDKTIFCECIDSHVVDQWL